MFDYIRNPEEIYKKSFSLVRAETDFSGLSKTEEVVAVRLIHACGQPTIIKDLIFSKSAVDIGHSAIENGASVIVDAEMVAFGIIRESLIKDNEIVCTLNNVGVREAAKDMRTTRSAAAVDMWMDKLEGSIVVIGNAPTALFRLLEKLEAGAPVPALICGFAVGFVGAAESKEALIKYATKWKIPFITLRGRLGGSAIASATVNALAGNL
jgi:precorrin-8X/cobalt-precorrin-8 methylmutase